jgi:putative FmdB family regulatory protein
MPIYEYVCKPCEKNKEVLQGYGDPAPKCEKCQKEMKRQISQTSFQLKGGGWYKDGYQ